jgi:hypothetical protein
MASRILQHVNVVYPAGAGIEDTHSWEGRRRMFTRDPWGGRIEVLEGPAPAG